MQTPFSPFMTRRVILDQFLLIKKTITNLLPLLQKYKNVSKIRKKNNSLKRITNLLTLVLEELS